MTDIYQESGTWVQAVRYQQQKTKHNDNRLVRGYTSIVHTEKGAKGIVLWILLRAIYEVTKLPKDNTLNSTLYESNIISDPFYTHVIIILLKIV
jgi:hypothetical protein